MSKDSEIILNHMGIERKPDDPQSAEQLLNTINRQRIEINIQMEPDPEMRAKMAEYALRAYPLPSDEV